MTDSVMLESDDRQREMTTPDPAATAAAAAPHLPPVDDVPVLRAATADDAPAMAALIRVAFEEYRGVLEPPSSGHGQTAESLRREMADGGAFVVEAGGEAVACVLHHPRGDHAYLDRLAVAPSWRGRGLAGRLVAAVEAWARAADLPACRLSVRLSLAENRAWYEQLGYGELSLGTHAGHPAPTFVTLQKRLDGDSVESTADDLVAGEGSDSTR